MADFKTVWTSPVTNGEQMLQRYQTHVGTTCLSGSEQSYLKANFSKFSPTSSSWTNDEFRQFFGASFFSQAGTIFQEAAPIVYRLMSRLGKYPHHIHAEEGLDFDTLRQAICMIAGRDDDMLRRVPSSTSQEEHKAHLKQRNTRLLFQCMMPDLDGTQDSRTRTDDEDEDIRDAHRIVSTRKILRDGSNPKVGTRVLAPPPPEDLPSSWSGSLDGYIQLDQFQAIVKLLLCCQLHQQGIGPELVAEDMSESDSHIIQTVELLFHDEKNGVTEKGVHWETFRKIFDTKLPNLFNGLRRVIAPVIQPPGLSLEAFDSLDTQTLLDHLRSNSATDTALPTDVLYLAAFASACDSGLLNMTVRKITSTHTPAKAIQWLVDNIAAFPCQVLIVGTGTTIEESSHVEEIRFGILYSSNEQETDATYRASRAFLCAPWWDTINSSQPHQVALSNGALIVDDGHARLSLGTIGSWSRIGSKEVTFELSRINVYRKGGENPDDRRFVIPVAF